MNGFDDIPFFDEEPAPRPAKPQAASGGIAARAMAARQGSQPRPSYLEGLNPEQLGAHEDEVSGLQSCFTGQLQVTAVGAAQIRDEKFIVFGVDA